MRDEFERNRYWIGIYRTDVEFDEGLGEFGRYVSSGTREVDTGDLETFNERWEAYANAWSFQQKKLDDLKQIVDAWKLVEARGGLITSKKYLKFLQSSVDMGLYHGLYDINCETEIPLISKAIVLVEKCYE